MPAKPGEASPLTRLAGMRQPDFIHFSSPLLFLPNLAVRPGRYPPINRALVFALVLVAAGALVAAEAESPDRVDPVLDCSTPVLDADTAEKARLLQVQYGADAIVPQLRTTYTLDWPDCYGSRRKARKAGWPCD